MKNGKHKGYQAPATLSVRWGSPHLTIGAKQSLMLTSGYDFLPQALFIRAEMQVISVPSDHARVLCQGTEVGLYAPQAYMGDGILPLRMVRFVDAGPHDVQWQGQMRPWPVGARFALPLHWCLEHTFEISSGAVIVGEESATVPWAGLRQRGETWLHACQHRAKVYMTPGGVRIEPLLGSIQSSALHALTAGRLTLDISFYGQLYAYRAVAAVSVGQKHVRITFIP